VCAVYTVSFPVLASGFPSWISLSYNYDRIDGPAMPEKLLIYHAPVAAPAFLVMIGSSKTVFYKTIRHTTVFYLYSASLDFGCQLGL
jgi:hypothetical protein